MPRQLRIQYRGALYRVTERGDRREDIVHDDADCEMLIEDSPKGLGLLDYRWSSLAQGYALPPGKRSKWLRAEEGLGMFDLPDTTDGRRRFIERLEQRVSRARRRECGLPAEEVCKGGQSTLRRGWFWGTQAFDEWLRGKVRESSARPEGRALRANAESRACYDEGEA